MSQGFMFATLPHFHINEVRIKRLIEIVNNTIFEDDDEKEVVLSHIEKLEDTVASGEVAVYQQTKDIYKVWITGGMSGGDAPTDAFEVFCGLSQQDFLLWSEMESFARDDISEELYLAE